ncbi:dihydropteroate synthase [Mycetocola tolaasinivorans]|uniref:Dihydropteroate synthase n=1 Tax=Mycetocola tolaasinivorans TaxID=76635 RepID=A0A3L6ZVC8_9MICO|nr:dihydropteroate synthase [Mycetocola tolaasinivorans]RLP71837.1 dihydropteroate synthase [Mycetocola tolaasinivorans]
MTARPPARPLLMGVLNVTPDSFSDGGRYLAPEDAIARGRALVAAGAAIVDVGGESTRPGAEIVGVDEEIARIRPAIAALHAEGITTSIDTMNAETARIAVAEGALYVNDVSGGQSDPELLGVVAASESAILIAGHWRGRLDAGDSLAHYDDPVAEVVAELEGIVAAARAAGIPDSRIILDPGLGFSKTAEHNWEILRGLDRLSALGFPLLIGASRKRFLGELLPEDTDVRERDLPTAVLSALVADAGVWGLRVHEPAASARALDVWEHLRG